MMRRTVPVIVAILMAAVGCSPSGEPTDAASGPNPGAPAATQKRLPLPDCSEVETQDAGADGWVHPDCRLMLADDTGLAIEARYTSAADASTVVSIQVVSPGDATIQIIEETMGNTFESVKLEDADRDGLEDVWIPLETGNVNTAWAIWRQTESMSFARAGEVNGVDIQYAESGHFVVPARSSAADWIVRFYAFEGGILTQQASVNVSATMVEGGEVAASTCTLRRDEVVASGLPLADAEARFCAEPAAAGIFK